MLSDEELLSNLDAGERSKLAHRKHATTEYIKLFRWALVLAVIFGTLHECIPQVMDGYATRQKGQKAVADLLECKLAASDEMLECQQRTIVPLKECVDRLDALRSAVGQRILESAVSS